MAEVLGVVSSVIALIQITDRVITLVKCYIDYSSSGPPELRTLLVELYLISALLKSLEFFSQHDAGASDLFPTICESMQGYQQAVLELKDLFPANVVALVEAGEDPKLSKISRVQRLQATLEWSRKAGRAKELLDQISQHKTDLNLELTLEMTRDLKIMKRATGRIYDMNVDRRLQDVCEWLQATDPSPLYNRAMNDHEDGTGKWMLLTPEWADWLNGTFRCIHISGIPGAGKTVLASFLVQTIKEYCYCNHDGSLRAGYAYYYCYFLRKQDETSPFLRWIICQLCRQAGTIPSRLNKLYRTGTEPSQIELLETLESVLELFDIAYVVIDALDESDPRDNLLEIIELVATSPRFSKLQLLTTSRIYPDIMKAMACVSKAISMSNSHVENDIRLRVRSLLKSNAKFRRWPADLITETENTIATQAEGMFRLTVCQVDVLRRIRPDRNSIEDALAKLPKDVNETYERIFRSIPAGEWFIIKSALHLTWFHYQMYTCNLPRAILRDSINLLSKSKSNPTRSHHHDEEDVQELCGCLIRVDDEEVAFARYTVMEYLKEENVQQPDFACFAIQIEKTYDEQLEFLLSFMLDTLPHWNAVPHHRCGHLEVDQSLFYTHESSVWDVINGGFPFFCAMTTARLLKSDECLNTASPRLWQLLFKLMDPTAAHFVNMSLLIFDRLLVSEWQLPDRIFFKDGTLVHAYDWIEFGPYGRAAALLNLILHCPNRTKEHVRQAVALFKDDMKILTETMKIGSMGASAPRCDLRKFSTRFSTASHYISGTIAEMLCQITPHSAQHCASHVNFVLDAGYEQVDWSEIMMAYLGHHYGFKGSGECAEECLLRRCLDNGADANYAKYRIAPIQIAVHEDDFFGVEMLLEANADPNSVGNSSGLTLPKKDVRSRFDYLYGRSPLRILKDDDPDIDLGYDDPDIDLGYVETERMAIRLLLLKYGARDIE